MHNVKKSFKRLLAVSLCASCVLSNGMLSLAEGAEDKAVNLALGCRRLQMPSTIKTVMI